MADDTSQALPPNLLQMLAGAQNDGLTGGLMGLSAALLQAGGPSRAPTSFGQALGQGMQAWTQGRNQAYNTALTNAKGAYEIGQLQRQIGQQKLLDEYRKGAMGGQPSGAPGGAQPVGMGGAPMPSGGAPSPLAGGSALGINPAMLDDASLQKLILERGNKDYESQMELRKQGYLFKADGTMGFIPGSPADPNVQARTSLTAKGMLPGQDGSYAFAPGVVDSEVGKEGKMADTRNISDLMFKPQIAGETARATLPSDIAKVSAEATLRARLAPQQVRSGGTDILSPDLQRAIGVTPDQMTQTGAKVSQLPGGAIAVSMPDTAGDVKRSQEMAQLYAQITQEANDARAANVQLGTIKKVAPDAITGAFPAAKLTAAKTLQKITPWSTPGLDKSIAASEELDKAASNMAMAQGSRSDAALAAAEHGNPNRDNSDLGLQGNIAAKAGQNQRPIDRLSEADKWLSSHPSLVGFQEWFDKTNPPEKYQSDPSAATPQFTPDQIDAELRRRGLRK